MLKHNLNRTMVASAITLALTGPISTIAAEKETDKDVEVIEVRGVIGSLIKSADLKRSSEGVTDAITAEDIGKFPDTNLAESLQRITGVSIDRENGEGRGVTVRGLGPQFNLTQLNGRQLASADTSGRRSFNWSTISSDMIGGVEVHKTSEAKYDTGGMGATINVKTLRPLTQPKDRALVSAKAINDTSSESGSLTPELSALYSSKFYDDTVGVAVAVNYHERENGHKQAAQNMFWITNTWGEKPRQGWLRTENAVNNPYQTNKPEAGDLFSLPRMTSYNLVEQEHERLNGQIVFQWRPFDGLTTTLDYNLFQKEIKGTTNRASIWYDWIKQSSTAVWNDDPIKSPTIYGEVATSPRAGETTFYTEEQNTKDKLDALGLNIDWQISEDLAVEIDINRSTSALTPNDSHLGSKAAIEMASLTRRAIAIDWTGEIPAVYLNQNNVLPQDVVPLNHWIESAYIEAEVNQVKADFTYELADEMRLDFGVSSSTVSYATGNVRVERKRGYYEQYKGEFADFDGFETFSFMDKFDANYGDFVTEAAKLPNGTTLSNHKSGDAEESYVFSESNLYSESLTFDIREMYDYITDNYANDVPEKDSAMAMRGSCGTIFCATNKYEQGTLEKVEETIDVAYLQWNWFPEIFDMPASVHIGVRHETTDVVSDSAVKAFGAVQWNNKTSVNLIDKTDANGNAVVDIGQRVGSYSNVLPNINFNIELTDNFVARAGWSKTISRPNYGSLKGGVVLNNKANPYLGRATSGNPDVEPLESTNIDLSFEYYYDEGSYASVGIFKKEISNFVGGGGEEVITIDGIHQPGQGQYAQEAMAATGSTDLETIFTWILENKNDDPNVVSSGGGTGYIVANPATDPLMEFDLKTPVNNDLENGVDGVEIAIQHMFGQSGFGMITNYTVVDTDIEYDPYSLEGSNALIGVSDSANIVGFYDNNGINVRLAYNWRDKFLSAHTQSGQPEPQFTKAYNSLDLNVSYDINESTQVFLQGINILNEKNVIVGRTDHQIYRFNETGPRWVLGARIVL